MWFIKGINVFSMFPDALVDAILKNTKTMTLDREKYIRPKEETLNHVWIVKSGELKILKKTEDMKEIKLAEMEPGEFFGFISPSSHVKRLLYSPTGSICYLISRDIAMSIFLKLPKGTLKREININGKLIEIQPEPQELLFKNPMLRVMDAVKFLVENTGVNTSKGKLVKSKGLLDTLASVSFQSIPVVILCLSAATKSGILEVFQDSIIVKDEARLG